MLVYRPKKSRGTRKPGTANGKSKKKAASAPKKPSVPSPKPTKGPTNKAAKAPSEAAVASCSQHSPNSPIPAPVYSQEQPHHIHFHIHSSSTPPLAPYQNSPSQQSSTSLVRSEKPPSSIPKQPKLVPKLRRKPTPPSKKQPNASFSSVDLSEPPCQLKTKGSKALLAAGDALLGNVGSRLDLLSGDILGCGILENGLRGVDLIAAKLNSVLTSIDCDRFSGKEEDLCVVLNANTNASVADVPAPPGSSGHTNTRSAAKAVTKVATSVERGSRGVNVFAKAWLYSNSRLPPWLPPLKLAVSAYPLICLAAQFSERAYDKPIGDEAKMHVEPNWRAHTKAMVIKSVPVDNADTIVVAIRGSQSFMDWAVNWDSEPTSPDGFLDDAGNLCHSGFLSTAKAMLQPISERLRNLLEENPARSAGNLVFTGHSAGGAVASLLYAHIVSQQAGRTELGVMAGCFGRVHCVTFGAPPVGLLPLEPGLERRRERTRGLWLSFMNEGDPLQIVHPPPYHTSPWLTLPFRVPRADKPYVRSLLDLYASPAPKPTGALLTPPSSPPKNKLPSFTALLKPSKPKLNKSQSAPVGSVGLHTANGVPQGPYWTVPPCTLSIAGIGVVLRDRTGVPSSSGKNEVAIAQVINDPQIRGIVWGDPVMHLMRVYRRRVESLATRAVIGDQGSW